MTSRCQCWFSLRNKIFRDFRRSQNWGSLQRFLVFATHPHCTYTGKHTFNEPTWTNQTNRPTRMSKKKHGKTTVSSQVLKVFPTRIRIFTSPTNLPNNQKTGESVKKHGESVFKKTREPPGYIFTSNSRIDTRVFGILQSNYPMSSIPWTEWLKEKNKLWFLLDCLIHFFGGGPRNFKVAFLRVSWRMTKVKPRISFEFIWYPVILVPFLGTWNHPQLQISWQHV